MSRTGGKGLAQVHNARMKSLGRWLAWTLLLVCLVLVAAVFALQRWIGTDDFRVRVQIQAQAMLGVPVLLGRLQIDPWPVPAVALERLVIRTRAPLTADRVELRLRLHELLAGRLEVSSLRLSGADLPQQGIDELLAALNDKPAAGAGTAKPAQGASAAPGQSSGPPLVLIARRVVLEDVTWRNLRGESTTLSGDADLGADGLPEQLKLAVSAGPWQGMRAGAKQRVQPAEGLDARAPSWDIRIEHAGGTIEGPLQVRLPVDGASRMSLRGQFETRNLELSALRKGAPGPLSGRLRATTSVSAQAETTAELAQVLVTQSRFTVQDAVVHGVDLARAVRTVGLNRGGQTRLDQLSGQLVTRGRAIQLRELAASSGALSVTGEVAVAPSRTLSGRVNVNLAEQVVGKAVGVPLVVGGTLDAPSVTLTRGAMLGAAIGTMVMPGVGTGTGASIGDAIGDKLKGLFKK
jgi:hypothetical protein